MTGECVRTKRWCEKGAHKETIKVTEPMDLREWNNALLHSREVIRGQWFCCCYWSHVNNCDSCDMEGILEQQEREFHEECAAALRQEEEMYRRWAVQQRWADEQRMVNAQNVERVQHAVLTSRDLQPPWFNDTVEEWRMLVIAIIVVVTIVVAGIWMLCW